MDTQTLEPAPDQSIKKPSASIKISPVVFTLLLAFCILLSVFSVYLYSENNKLRAQILQSASSLPTRVPTVYPESVQEQVSVIEPSVTVNTDTWKTFTDKKTGITLKYPPDVVLNSNNTTQALALNIFSESYQEILVAEETGNISVHTRLGFDSNTYLLDYESLMISKYGENIYCGHKDSRKVVRLGNIYAKTFDVLACLDAADVILDRVAVFYPDKDHRIIVNLSGPKEKIIAENPEYFSGEYNWWKNAENPSEGYGLNAFYEDLVQGKTGPVSREWYLTFDQILGTVTL